MLLSPYFIVYSLYLYVFYLVSGTLILSFFLPLLTVWPLFYFIFNFTLYFAWLSSIWQPLISVIPRDGEEKIPPLPIPPPHVFIYFFEFVVSRLHVPETRVGHPFFSKECSVLCVLLRSFQKNVPFFPFFYILFKRTFRSFRSFPFF